MYSIWLFSISFREISFPQGYATNVTQVSLMRPVSNFCSSQDRWDLATERPLDHPHFKLPSYPCACTIHMSNP